MTIGVRWTRKPEDAFDDLHRRYESVLRNYVHAVVLSYAPRIENWMKANALWTDRTGNARQTLYTQVIPALTEVVLLMGHGVDYGIHLELRNAGKYAIISPAIDHWAPIIMDEIRRGIE